jgi:hypothetical protein
VFPPIIPALFLLPEGISRSQKYDAQQHIQSRKSNIGIHGTDNRSRKPDDTQQETKINMTHKITSIQISVLFTAMVTAYRKKHFCAVTSMNGGFLSIKKKTAILDGPLINEKYCICL